MNPIFIRAVLGPFEVENCRRHPDRKAVYFVSTLRKDDRRRGVAFACQECVEKYRKYGLAAKWPKEKKGEPVSTLER